MKYDNYLKTIAAAFDGSFDYIDATFGFDYGVEFEIALCRALRSILPARIGVCRGFVVPEDGPVAGDDIIIFDRHHFPVLRMLEQDAFDRKQKIPVDAVYAYIEAKHTLVIEGDGPSSLAHAEDQVQKVQQLDGVAREKTQMDCYRVGINETCFDRNSPPPGRSPIFGAIVSRFVKVKGSDTNAATPEQIRDALKCGHDKQLGEGHFITDEDWGICSTDAEQIGHQPDLVVAGRSNILLPFEIRDGANPLLVSPFSVPGKTRLCHAICRDLSFAMGVCSLLWSLEMAHLGRMPWPVLLADAFSASRPPVKTEAKNAK